MWNFDIYDNAMTMVKEYNTYMNPIERDKEAEEKKEEVKKENLSKNPEEKKKRWFSFRRKN